MKYTIIKQAQNWIAKKALELGYKLNPALRPHSWPHLPPIQESPIVPITLRSGCMAIPEGQKATVFRQIEDLFSRDLWVEMVSSGVVKIEYTQLPDGKFTATARVIAAKIHDGFEERTSFDDLIEVPYNKLFVTGHNPNNPL